MSQNNSIHMHLMYLSSVSLYQKYCIYYKSVTLIIKKKKTTCGCSVLFTY